MDEAKKRNKIHSTHARLLLSDVMTLQVKSDVIMQKKLFLGRRFYLRINDCFELNFKIFPSLINRMTKDSKVK